MPTNRCYFLIFSRLHGSLVAHGHCLPHSSRQAECGCFQAAYMETNPKENTFNPLLSRIMWVSVWHVLHRHNLRPKKKSGRLLLMKISQKVLQYKSCKRSKWTFATMPLSLYVVTYLDPLSSFTKMGVEMLKIKMRIHFSYLRSHGPLNSVSCWV